MQFNNNDNIASGTNQPLMQHPASNSMQSAANESQTTYQPPNAAISALRQASLLRQ